MSDINSVVVCGRLVRDIGTNDFGYLPNGTPKLSFSIAVNRSVKKNDQWVEEASFFDVVLFGKSGEAIKPYLRQGSQVGVQGSLKQDRWEKDGQKRSKVVIMADNVRLLGGKSEGQGGQTQGQSYGQPAPANADGFPDSIPF